MERLLKSRHVSISAGFSAVEVLIALSVISLLLALLLPAVQNARESSRRVQCTNHLAQFGRAFMAFESTNRVFPPRARRTTDPPSPIRPSVVWHPYPVSVHYDLLPYLDQTALYETVTFDEPWYHSNDDPPSIPGNSHLLLSDVAVFGCPSDDVPQGATSYRINAGTSPSFHHTPDIPPPNSALDGFGRWGHGVKAARVTDGLSQTVAFAERLVGDQNPDIYTPSRDTIDYPSGLPLDQLRLPDAMLETCRAYASPTARHTSFDGTGWLIHRLGTTVYNHILEPNAVTPDCGGAGGAGAYTARSLHPGGVNVTMGDGAVRFVSEAIDRTVWRAVGTINGGEVEQLR
jgi:prepilin-type processing-associated H-X9-DG protein